MSTIQGFYVDEWYLFLFVIISSRQHVGGLALY